MAEEGKDGPGRSPENMGTDEDRDMITVGAEDLPAEREEAVVAERVDDPLTVGQIVGGARSVASDLGTSARRFVDRGRYRKLRISRKGKPVLPDIPLAAVAAVEAASLAGAGLARVLAVNVGARFLFDIDVVNEADKFLEIGRKALLDGDLDTARTALDRAVRIDDTHAEAFLQLGVLHRLQGRTDESRESLARAHELDELGEHGKRAQEILRAIDGSREG